MVLTSAKILLKMKNNNKNNLQQIEDAKKVWLCPDTQSEAEHNFCAYWLKRMEELEKHELEIRKILEN